VEKESLELLLGQGLSVEKIGKRVGKDPSTVSYWMAKYGLEAVNREKHAAKGGIDQERLSALVAAGKTIAEIAAEVGLSKTAVRHWLRRYGLKTMHGPGRRPAGGTRVASDGHHGWSRSSAGTTDQLSSCLRAAGITAAVGVASRA